jgi:hypothetical protein
LQELKNKHEKHPPPKRAHSENVSSSAASVSIETVALQMRLEVDINLEARVKGEITNALHMPGNTCPFQAEQMLKATAALWL